MKSSSSFTKFCLVALFAIVTAAQVEHQGLIKRCTRSLALLEPDVVVYTNDISFMPENDYQRGSKTVF